MARLADWHPPSPVAAVNATTHITRVEIIEPSS
jgi:hypothetical protein